MNTHWLVQVNSTIPGTDQKKSEIRFSAESSPGFSKATLVEAGKEDLTWVARAMWPSPPKHKTPQQIVEEADETDIERAIVSELSREATIDAIPNAWSDVSLIRIFKDDQPSDVSFVAARFGIKLWSLNTPLLVAEDGRITKPGPP